MSDEMKKAWTPDRCEAHFLDKLKIGNFKRLKAPLKARAPRPTVYLYRNLATITFLGQANELITCLDKQVQCFNKDATKVEDRILIQALFNAVVVHLRAALDSLAGEVDLLLCDGDTKNKRISMHERCFRCRLKKEAKSLGVAAEIKKRLDALESNNGMKKTKRTWYEDLRDYRNEAGHRVSGFLYFERPSPGHKGRRVRILKPNLSDERIEAIFSELGKGQEPQEEDFAGTGYIEEQLRTYLDETVKLVDAVWGHLATYVEAHGDMLSTSK